MRLDVQNEVCRTMKKVPALDSSCWTLPDYIEWSRDQIFRQNNAFVNLQTRLENRVRIQEENSMLARGERKELFEQLEATQGLLTAAIKSLDRHEGKIKLLKLVMDHYADVAPRFSEVMNQIQEDLDRGQDIPK